LALLARTCVFTVTPPKSPLAKAVTGFLKRTPKTDAAPADVQKATPVPKNNNEATGEITEANPTYESNVAL
jgi:hypothetical protein